MSWEGQSHVERDFVSEMSYTLIFYFEGDIR